MKQRKVEVSYEGMGTNISATISVGGKLVVGIYAINAKDNLDANEIVIRAKKYLLKKEKLRCKTKTKDPYVR